MSRREWILLQFLTGLGAALLGTVAGGLVMLIIARQLGLNEPLAHLVATSFKTSVSGKTMTLNEIFFHNVGDNTARSCSWYLDFWNVDPSSDSGSYQNPTSQSEFTSGDEIRPDATLGLGKSQAGSWPVSTGVLYVAVNVQCSNATGWSSTERIVVP